MLRSRAAAVSVAAGGGLVLAGSGAPSDSGGFSAAPNGWGIGYPAGFRAERSGTGDGPFEEITVANFRPSAGVVTHAWPGGANVRLLPPVAPDGRFPASGVALRASEDAAGPLPVTQPNTALPVELSRFRHSGRLGSLSDNAATGETPVADRYRNVPASSQLTVYENGAAYLLVAWVGPRASAASRARLARAVAALYVPP